MSHTTNHLPQLTREEIIEGWQRDSSMPSHVASFEWFAAGAAFAAAALRLKLQQGPPIMAGVLATGDASHGCGEGPAGETGDDDEQ